MFKEIREVKIRMDDKKEEKKGYLEIHPEKMTFKEAEDFVKSLFKEEEEV